MRTVPLGDVAEFVRGITYKPAEVTTADDPNAIPCMRTKNIQVDLEDDDLVYIPSRLAKPEKRLREGDVLVSSANSWNLVGKCSWVPALPYDATFGGFTSVLRTAEPTLLPRYLFHWFSTGQVQALARSFGQQTTNISNLNQARCLDLEIPLPPLPEQRRIAAILDKADALRRQRQRAVDLLDSLTQSIFLEMFGAEASDLGRWGDPVPLSEVATIGSGITKGRKTNGQVLREVPYLAVANVQDRRLELDNVKTIEATDDEIERFRLEPGDLLLTEGGDPDKLGRGSLWGGEIADAIHQNHIFRVRIAAGRVEPIYLNWLVGSRYGKAYFLSVAKQTTGIASINKSQLSAFPTILPPMELQQRFVRRVREAARLAEEAVVALDHASSLFASLQSRAFAGEL